MTDVQETITPVGRGSPGMLARSLEPGAGSPPVTSPDRTGHPYRAWVQKATGPKPRRGMGQLIPPSKRLKPHVVWRIHFALDGEMRSWVKCRCGAYFKADDQSRARGHAAIDRLYSHHRIAHGQTVEP